MVVWFVLRDQIQDEALSPLAELLNPVQQVVNDRLVDRQTTLLCQNFVQGRDAVRDDL